jgi:hypothetical protein
MANHDGKDTSHSYYPFLALRFLPEAVTCSKRLKENKPTLWYQENSHAEKIC